MNFAHLRTFVAIADHGGFGRAAARLNLTQSAASRQIQGLEAELGVKLFDRIGRGVQLTSEGEDLLRRFRRVLAEVETVGERARLLKGGETGILRVGATPQVIENLLANFLSRYRSRHPNVEVHLVEDGGVRLYGRLERGDVHLTLTAVSGRFESRLLYPMHALAALAPTHRLARRAKLEIAELADEPLLLLKSRFWIARLVRCRLQRRPYPAPGAAGKRRPAHAHRAGRDRLRHRSHSLECASASRHRSYRAAGTSRGIGRKVGDDRLGSATLPGAIRRAVRRGDRRPLPPQLSRPRSHPACAAVTQAKGNER